jgi:hypothetical protein
MSELGFPCPRCGPRSPCDGYLHLKLVSGLIGGYVVRAKELSESEQYLVGLLPIAPPSRMQRLLATHEL